MIPAFNEEERIGATLVELLAYLERQDFSSSITVVDNGSTDRTAETVDRITPTSVPVRVIGCSRPGKGAAVRRGVLAATSRWVGFCDADLATPVETIGPIVDLLRERRPVVIASRRCEGARYVTSQSVGRRLGGLAFRSVVRSLVPDVADTQCGFKFFRADVAHSLFGPTEAEGFAFDVEVIARARRNGLRVTEVPVAWTAVGGSTFRPLTDGLQAFRELFQLRSRLVRSAA